MEDLADQIERAGADVILSAMRVDYQLGGCWVRAHDPVINQSEQQRRTSPKTP